MMQSYQWQNTFSEQEV